MAMSKILSSLAVSAVLEDGGGGGGGTFAAGPSESPSTMFTRQYSINAMNTKIVQTDMKASTAFRYETGGNEAWLLACCVERVSNEVTPRVTLAGAASGFIQNDTHCDRRERSTDGIIVAVNTRQQYGIIAKDNRVIALITHRHNNDQARRDVSVEQVIAEASLQYEYDFEAGEVTLKART